MGLKVYLVFVALLHMKQSHQDSCMLTNMCPATRELWNQRSKTFNCTERGTNYTCMLNKENLLVETCMYENVIGKEIVGCPSITTCKDSPQIAPENHYTDCPEDIPGCPKWNHEPYTIFEMYKYPACFYSDKYEYAFLNILPTTTDILDKTQRPTTDQSSATPVGLIIGIAIAITVALTVILVIVVLVLVKRCFRRKREGLNITADEENMTLLKDVTQNAIEEKQSTHSQPLLNGPASEGSNITADEENMTLIKDVTQNAIEEKQSTHSQPLLFGPEGSNITADEENMTLLKDVTQNVIEENQSAHLQPLLSDPGKTSIMKLKQILIEISKNAVKSISLSPIQKICHLPVELLFAKVIVKTHDKIRLLGKEMLYTRTEQKTEVRDPNDIFYKNGKPTKRIYMKGEAARGKTTYCLWLLHHWLNTQQRIENSTEVNEWENALGKFDFVFFIRLRDVDKSRATVIDMICYDVLKIKDKEFIECVQYVLNTNHCLIIIDGLDEWNPNQNVTKHSNFKGMPIIDGIENCVIFSTMRTWKFGAVEKYMQSDDSVTEIQGLDKAGIKSTTENILKYHYGLDATKSTDEQKYNEVLDKIENNTFGSIMEIPLLAVICVQILYKGEELVKSLTRFYIEMIGMLIHRAQVEHENDTIQETLETTEDQTKAFFSDSLCKHPIVSKYISVLSKLGKVAYSWLLSGKHSSEFYDDTLAKELDITEEEIEFLFNVGLLSKEEVDSTLTKKVKVSFFHKSVQEFLGALYIADKEAIRNLFFRHVSSTHAIRELGNVLIFLSGLNHMLGSVISQHIINVTNRDVDICERRNFKFIILLTELERALYELHVSCYREFVYAQKDTVDAQHIEPYHVSDIHVLFDSDEETKRATAEILISHSADIKVLSIYRVPTDSKKGIPDSVLMQFLDQSQTLESFYLNGFTTNRILYRISDRFVSLTSLMFANITLTSLAVRTLQSLLQTNRVIETLGLQFVECQVDVGQCDDFASLSRLIQILPGLPRLSTLRIQLSNKDEKPAFLDVLSSLSHLKRVEYYHTTPEDHEYDSKVIKHFCNWTEMQWLLLGSVNLSGMGLNLSTDMNVLQTLVLDHATMSEKEWYSFVQAINKIDTAVEVFLNATNIDERSISMIRSSEHCVLLPNTIHDKSDHDVHFLRIWPPSIRNQYIENYLTKYLGGTYYF